MYTRVVTKDNKVIWIKTGQTVGRHEIARMEFARWQASRIRAALKKGIEL